MYASLPVWVLPAFDPLMSDPFQYTRVCNKRLRVSIKYNLQTFTSGGGEGGGLWRAIYNRDQSNVTIYVLVTNPFKS